MKKKLIIYCLFMSPLAVHAQVGINTANPQGTFHIDGAKDNATTGTPTSNQQLNDFIVRNNGYVGIGTTTPFSKVEIIADNQGEGTVNDFNFRGYGTSKLPALIFSSANGDSSALQNLVQDDPIGAVTFIPRSNNGYSYNGGTRIVSYYQGDGSNNLTDLRISTSGNERVRITEAGNVGIGTTSPTATLDVAGNARVRNMSIAPGPTVVTPVYADADGVLNKAVDNIYGAVINNTVTVAPGNTDTLISGLVNNSAYKAVVYVTNQCGRIAVAEYYVINNAINSAFAIKGIDGLVNTSTTSKAPVFNEINKETTSVTWPAIPPCVGGGAAAYNYTLTMSLGTLSITNNGEADRSYRVILTRLF